MASINKGLIATEGMITMTATLTTADIAAEFGTTPRELRKFLRSPEGPGKVGKGARYSLPGTKRELTKLHKAFDAWSAAKAESAQGADEAADEAVIEDDAE